MQIWFFSISFNTEHTFYVRDEQLANGHINILSDEEFKTSIEGSLIPVDVLLSYLSGSAYTPETLEDEDVKEELVEETPVDESVLKEVIDSEETVAVTSELIKKESATEVVELSPVK